MKDNGDCPETDSEMYKAIDRRQELKQKVHTRFNLESAMVLKYIADSTKCLAEDLDTIAANMKMDPIVIGAMLDTLIDEGKIERIGERVYCLSDTYAYTLSMMQ